LNSAASTVGVKFEDSKITIEEIVERIKKGKFKVTEAVEAPPPEETMLAQ